jgi:hypothetical protein
MTMASYPIHPANQLFPPLSAGDYAVLRHAIKSHGVQNPIWLDGAGTLLDGVHRLRACTELSIPCPTQTYTGNDPVGFIRDQNIHRRHLTTAERAKIGAALANLAHGTNRYERKKVDRSDDRSTSQRPMTQAQAAATMRVSESTLRRAKAKARAAKKETMPPPTNAERLRQYRARRQAERSRAVAARQSVVEATDAKVLAAIELLAADDRAFTDKEIQHRTKLLARDLIRYTRLLDWLTIERTGAGTRFTIDHQLRASIQLWKVQPSLPSVTVAATLPAVLAELRRRRQANHDRMKQARWDVRDINKLTQREYLNWVETELDHMVQLLTSVPMPSAGAPPTLSSAEDDAQETISNEHHENGRTVHPTDPRELG